MPKVYLIALAVVLSACSSVQTAHTPDLTNSSRTPSGTVDLSGTYLGEGLYSSRPFIGGGIRRPAMRIYLERAEGETDSYYGALVEYDKLLNMALPYLSSQKAPFFNKIFLSI